MYENHAIGSIVYMLVMIQCVATMVTIILRVKKTQTVVAILCAQGIVVWWLFFGILEIQSANNAEMMFAARFTLFAVHFIGGASLIFALSYAGILHEKNRWIIGLILFPLVATYWPALTKNYYYLTIAEKNIETHMETTWGVLASINFNITHLYIVMTIVVIVIKSFMDYKKLKWKAGLVAVGALIPLTLNILLLYNVIEGPGFDMTPMSLSLFLFFLALAIFRFEFFDVVHEATMDVFYNAEEPVMILDNDYTIMEYNKAFILAFGHMIQPKKLFHLDDFLFSCHKYSANPEDVNLILKSVNQDTLDSFEKALIFKESEIFEEKKYYEFHIKRLYNDEGEQRGSLVTLKDKTITMTELIAREKHLFQRNDYDHIG